MIKRGISILLQLIASFCYLGYIPIMPGTIGTLIGVGLYLAWIPINSLLAYALVCIGLFLLGVVSSGYEEIRCREKDAAHIIIDEVFAFFITMYGIQFSWYAVFIGFFLNRIADILKPFPANISQRLPGGLGIMVDDLIAAIYSNIILRIIILLTGKVFLP
ncbi:phosphatidylglycerophosphatase A [Chlamydiota bacterium]